MAPRVAVPAAEQQVLTDLGSALEHLRKARRISRETLADLAVLSPSTVYSAETGESCALVTYVKLVHALGYTLNISITLGPSPNNSGTR